MQSNRKTVLHIQPIYNRHLYDIEKKLIKMFVNPKKAIPL